MTVRQPNRTDLWWWLSRDQQVTQGFTSRRGGVSAPPWRGLNLATHVGDQVESVDRNRALLAQDLDIDPESLAFLDQVHGNDVVEVADDSPVLVGSADAMFTSTCRTLVVLVADCVPVLVRDVAGQWVGVAHAGRPGMVAGVVPRLVAAMRSAGAGELSAIVGPSISARCYEVPAQLRDEVQQVEPTAASVTAWGTPAVDVAAGVLTQLAECGVPSSVVAGCSLQEPDLFSYRRDGQTGRFAGVISRRE